MYNGFCYLGVVPVRKKAESSAEQVTQLLFGDTVSVIDEYKGENEITDSWFKIRNTYDDYEGWTDKRNILLYEPGKLSDNINQCISHKYIVSSSVAKIKTDDGFITVPMAAVLPDKVFSINNHNFALSEGSVIPTEKCNPLLIKAVSLLYLNTPYQWGGKSILGMDCSGFTQNVFRFAGIKLKRDAFEQATQGNNVSFESIKSGDLCFFDNKQGKITHVGIYLGGNQIIHCSGKVRIDTLDANGIITNEDGKEKYSHRLCKVQSFI
ncbi:MAG: C40 family peptidase [Bacteroidales bacterium]|nr:C40 family peptidase [Bacteroidales bacterium]